MLFRTAVSHVRHAPVSTRMWGLLAALLLLVGSLPDSLLAQAAKGAPREGAPPPPLTYHGLVPGVSTVADVRKKLGEPAHEAKWYAWKMLYSAKGGAAGYDAIHLQSSRGTGGKIGNIEAVSVPGGFETYSSIVGRLGDPEYHLTLPGGQHLVDYSEKGVRFTLDARRRTIGVAYFPHGYRRVHDGVRRRVDLIHLDQGPRGSRGSRGSRKEEASWPAPDLTAGAAEVDVSPRPELYERPFRLVSPLKARCAVFARGGLKVAVVGADLFGLLRSEIVPIEQRLREKGISHLIFASSHNHAAPDTIGIYGYYPVKYVEFIQEQVRRGVLRALDDLRPVAELLVSADDLSLAGARVAGLFRNARNPGIVDPQIAAVQARGRDGRPLVTLIQFACHVEGLSGGAKEISADFPGLLCDLVRQRTGAPAVFLNGALGGMVSGDSKARTHEEARITGERLAGEVERILGLATHSRSRTFYLRRRRLEVPVTNGRFIIFQKAYPTRLQWNRGRAVTEMLHLRLGDAEFLTVPGELLPEVSFEILERMTGYPRMIVGLAGDQLGYILPGYDFRKGSYEESMSVGPAAGPMVKECGLRLLQEAGP